MIRINLHIHSTCSDGVCSPPELVRLLSQNRVSIAALTDHDTAAGVPAFLAACRRRGIRGVSGIEISSTFEGDELHILGYRFDPQSPALMSALERCREARDARNAEICRRLSGLGLPVTLEEVAARAASRVVGRPHIAQVLLDKGRVRSIQEAFELYLAPGASAYVPRDLMPSAEAVELIRGAGGLPVWAHPLTSLSNRDGLDSALDKLAALGLWGVECWFHGASALDTFTCLNAAGSRRLYATAGTDFHGRSGYGARISGCLVREDLLPWARFCGGR